MATTFDAPAPASVPDTRWRTRDIVIAAVIGVAFAVVFWAWGLVWYGPLAPLGALALPVRDLGYAVWLIPAVLAPLIIRKPGAALFAEMVAAGLSVLLGTPWGPDALLSGFVQGVAAEVVFGFTLYRLWSWPILAIAAVASAAAAWIHDWVVYYPNIDPSIQVIRLVFMAISAVVIVAGGSVALYRSLKTAGVLEGFPGLTTVERRPGELAARNLSISHRGSDRLALDGVSFEVPAGRTMLVVGPSGSGKSTLALAIGGMIPRDIPAAMGGLLSLDGREIRGLEPTSVAARVGMVWQDPDSQLVMERVEDDVAFGLENRGWSRPAMRSRVPEVLDEMGLGGLERQRSRRLSGGQQQRLALAGALAPRPDVLVLDEPTANLDPPGAAEFMERLAALRAERSTTIVLIEHLVEAAWPMADLILALDGDGRPIDFGTPRDVERGSAARLRDAGIWLPAAVERRIGGAGDMAPDRPTDVGIVGHVDARPAIEATDLRFGFDRREPVIRDVGLQIHAGERVAFTGPNGSGKSTLARLLVGLLRPDMGTVRLLGDDPVRLSPAELARRAQYVFQDPERQFLARTVEEEVLLGLRFAVRPSARVLMGRLGLPLDRFGRRSPYRLSGGEQRRLSLACALVREPAVLVLDEPTFGQDRHGYDGLLEILRERLAAGATLIAATHDRRFVADATDRTIELDGGWIVADEPTRSVEAAS